MTDHVSYRHAQRFSALWLLLPISATALLLGVLAAPRTALEHGLGLAVALALPAAVLLLLGRLVIELRGPRLHWRFGYLGWPRWSVAIDDIERIEQTRSRALQGAGIKGLGSKRLYNVSLGGPALQLSMRDGRTILLGTPEPERLRSFIEARQTLPADATRR